MKQRKVFRSQFSFTKGEMQRAMLSAGTGFNMPVQVLSDNKSNFSKESFGLSDSNKFFPTLNVPNDIMPKPEDFIEAPFRLISATIVAGGTWRATDFSKGTVLKDSYMKLNNKPVYKDHDTDIDCWVGMVSNPKWTESFTDTNSDIKIPSGIDAILRIDAKTNPKIARGILVGGIFSNSVTVDFDWIPSHDIDNQDEFENLVGTYAADGRMITREVVEIHDYYESSLCWLGADPYAKLIDKDGNLVNVDITSAYDQESDAVKNGYKKDGKYSVSFCIDKNLISLSKFSSSNNSNNKPAKMNEILEALRLALGLGADAEVTPAMVAELKKVDANDATTKKAQNFSKLSKLAVVSLTSEETTPLVTDEEAVLAENVVGEVVVLKKEDFAQLKAVSKASEELKIGDAPATKEAIATLQAEALKVPTLTQEVETLKVDKKTAEDQLAADKPMAEEGKKFLQAKKDEAIRLYKVAQAGNVSEAVVQLFNDAGPEALEGLLAQYTKGVTAKFSGRCTKCGSEEFEFKSSLGTGDGNSGEENVETATDVSFSSIHAKFDKDNLKNNS